MKVGVISRGSPDYLIDIVCDGLIRLLGRANVCMDYTQKAQWGGQYAILMKGVEIPNTFDINDAEILVASSRSISDMEQWMRRTGKKAALIDGEDYPNLNYAPENVRVYFKREYLKGAAHPANVLPLSFGAIPEDMPSTSAPIDPVCFFFHPTHAFREKVAAQLVHMGYAPSTERIPKHEYNKRLVSSLVGVSVRGCGWDTYRYWETAYFGRALLSQRMQIVIPDNFIEDVEAVFFDDLKDFPKKLDRLVHDPAKALAIGAAGRRACLDRHMSIHRARRVLETVA